MPNHEVPRPQPDPDLALVPRTDARAGLRPPRLPPRWVIRSAWVVHRAIYRGSRGRLGLRPSGAGRYGMFHLTARGRRTGAERTVLLAYLEDGPRLFTLAMNGWGAGEPAWWLNLQADPVATVHLVGGTRRVRCRAAEGAERARLWQRWREIDPKLDAYAALRPTPTAVVVCEPA